MTPFFYPGPSPWGPPPVYLAAVGERMTEVAGEVCDGLMPHPFTTARYLRERTLPIGARGAARRRAAGSTDFSVSLSGFVVSGRTEEEMAAAARGEQEQIAFYGSTPGLPRRAGAARLGRAAGRSSTGSPATDDPGRWRADGRARRRRGAATRSPWSPSPSGSARDPAALRRLVDRFTFYAPYKHDPQLWQAAVEALR